MLFNFLSCDWTKYHHRFLSKSGFWSRQRGAIDYFLDLLDTYQFSQLWTASFSPRTRLSFPLFFPFFSFLFSFPSLIFPSSSLLLEQLDVVHIGILAERHAFLPSEPRMRKAWLVVLLVPAAINSLSTFPTVSQTS